MRPFLDLTNTNTASEDGETSPEFKEELRKTKQAGIGVIRVVRRCNDALENETLDLSECELMQIPEAVFHLMRNTNLKSCDLSFNVISKIPPKLGSKFSGITELNLSNNRMCKLPDELGQLSYLKSLDISFNSFLCFPAIAYVLPQLESVNCQKNFIADVDLGRLEACPSLKTLNMKENPLSLRTRDVLSAITGITVLLSPKEVDEEDDEEWDESTNCQ